MKNNSDVVEKRPQWIVCAAIRKNDRIMCGPRHYDHIMRKQIAASEGQLWWKSSIDNGIVDQGFIDQYGNYLTRDEAFALAKINNQIVRDEFHTQLYSEMLY